MQLHRLHGLKAGPVYDETADLQARSFTTPANSALTFGDFVPMIVTFNPF